MPVSIDHGMGIRRGTGILPVSIDHGMGIRRGTGILPVSCLFSGGQDAHSTDIHAYLRAGRMPTLLIFMLICGRAGCPLY
ncbi:MAG: hypothetical protein F6K53_11560 [Moorea sp. SIO4A1]|uniref:hypothetical protein n=1 Tax=Moorena sp. SIO4A1 TaxID=2607835 RepID=UPI00144FB165|nr:hypothetical protein [Moorena sp. SIO4A1]NEQ58007.1 hypothetical protein [Moorena sp. SIO4A1]